MDDLSGTYCVSCGQNIDNIARRGRDVTGECYWCDRDIPKPEPRQLSPEEWRRQYELPRTTVKMRRIKERANRWLVSHGFQSCLD